MIPDWRPGSKKCQSSFFVSALESNYISAIGIFRQNLNQGKKNKLTNAAF
jgi:hypothetical protein